TREEAARRLGWTPGSVKGRLERGRARLHARLVRRGLTLSAALGAVEVSRGSLAAGLPAGLASEAGGAAPAPGGLKGLSAATVGFGALLAASVLAAGVWRVLAAPGPEQPEPPGAASSDRSESRRAARTDRYGDPLPPGAIARLGTLRFR